MRKERKRLISLNIALILSVVLILIALWHAGFHRIFQAKNYDDVFSQDDPEFVDGPVVLKDRKLYREPLISLGHEEVSQVFQVDEREKAIISELFRRAIPRGAQLHDAPEARFSWEWGNIAFNCPRSMAYGEVVGVQLLLSTDQTPQQLAEQINERGEIQRYSIQISHKMEAHLTGKAFDIIAIAAEQQNIIPGRVTEWKWDVRPQEVGNQRLHLTLNATLLRDGKDGIYTIRTFSQEIDVNVAWPKSPQFFFQSHWQWILASIVIPFVGWMVGLKWSGK